MTRQEYERRYISNMRADRKARGVCTQCGKPDERTQRGMFMCQKCSDRHNEYQRVWRKKKAFAAG